jgi:hypothetical protein
VIRPSPFKLLTQNLQRATFSVALLGGGGIKSMPTELLRTARDRDKGKGEVTMRVPLSWLQEFVPIESDVDKIAHTLEMAGLGVEGIEEFEGDVVFDLEVTPQ